MKIFIQIASYRDPDLKNTIDDLITNAKYKSSLNFSICWQHSLDDSWDNIKHYAEYDYIHVIDVPHAQSKGACWARSLTQSLYNGEDFTLQIDSHTRSEPEWDVKLLDLYNSIGKDNTILSAYPSMFVPGESYEQYDKRIFSCHVYNMKNSFISARPKTLEDKSRPRRASTIAAGFIFGPGKLIQDVPYDPGFYFTGEEAALALRLFTCGYDLYHPNINLFYHYYTRKEQKKHWSDHKDWANYSNRAKQRLSCLLGKNNFFNMDKYGLGNIRTIEDWKQYSGIDYVKSRLHTHLIENKEPPYQDIPNLWISQKDLK